MTKIETVAKFHFSLVDNRPLLAVSNALIERGLDPVAVSEHIEAALAGECTLGNQKASTRSATKSAVRVSWKAKKDDGGKTVVKVAGCAFEFGDSPEARFIEICNRVEALAEMYVRIPAIKLPEAVLRHLAATEGLCFKTKEDAAKAVEAFAASESV